MPMRFVVVETCWAVGVVEYGRTCRLVCPYPRTVGPIADVVCCYLTRSGQLSRVKIISVPEVGRILTLMRERPLAPHTGPKPTSSACIKSPSTTPSQPMIMKRNLPLLPSVSLPKCLSGARIDRAVLYFKGQYLLYLLVQQGKYG